MTHSFAAHFGQRHFNAAFFTDYSAVLQTLVLTAQALIVFHRAKNLGAKQAIALRFLSTVVDRLRLLDFPVRPFSDFFRRCQTDLHRIESVEFEQSKNPLLP